MSTVYSDALVVLSLQKISNYPSQVVQEGLISGTSVLITNTGDSNKFGNIPGIFYINNEFNSLLYWDAIDKAIIFCVENFELISKKSLESFSPVSYVENLSTNLNIE
jgi:hypothetical protein